MTTSDNFMAAFEYLDSGNVEQLKTLLSSNPVLATERDEGNATLLIRLIDWPGNRPNSVDSANALLAAGADVDVRRNDENGTPLSGALCTENAGLIEVLLNAGANVHAPCGWQDGTVLEQADELCENYLRMGEDKIVQIANLISKAAGRAVPNRASIGNPVPLLFVSDFEASLKYYTEQLGFHLA